MTPIITCIGEPMGEITDRNGLTVAFGGDVLNTAVYCARAAGAHANVRLVTALGPDVVSDAALAFMESEGLDISHIRRHSTRPMGLYAIRTDDRGERSFHYWRQASAARTLFEDPEAMEFGALPGSDIIYLSGITLAIVSPQARDRLYAALCAAKQAGSRIALDSNYRPALWDDHATARNTMDRFWRITDIALPTIEDEQALFGDSAEDRIIDRLLGCGVRFGALKRGALGPVPFPATTETLSFPAADAVIDTTGAGDSFNGAYLAEIARGGNPAQAAQKGHAMAREVVGVQGAIL